MDKLHIDNKLIIGSREWCSLPDLHIPAIKAKVDTGAKTSAIHAVNIELVKIKSKKYVHFDVPPVQANHNLIVRCKAPVIDERSIMNSNGHKEHRYVISTTIKLGEEKWEIEITLSNRDPLKFPMLLGREALRKHVLIDPNKKYRQGKFTKKEQIALFKK